ncbi:NADH dehydrogenase subunit 3 (mitochondrion) [Neolecta irregularis DAH-3]|uniref:NADH-ubiquinone oxidoreductase chain 3 n=1 Tax=Neolecta irregularis (strain DAH-3) TaxID=1198029 RepID=A0A1U7LG30_NEOID|nr:NADH dehydrogenase subunit 3 [Neolecta irregularis DAH-3]|eukprot:OLL21610.1 NADH dehydrogenase subunit 3 (mitochondrion) [Neolecta irregularis DAH-3]
MTKLYPLECGFSAIGDSREKFQIIWFLVGILFIVLDLEILLVLNYAVCTEGGMYTFIVFFLFLGIVTIGYGYEICKKVLNFANSPRNTVSGVKLKLGGLEKPLNNTPLHTSNSKGAT